MLTSQAKIAEQISLRLRENSSDATIDERELMLSVHQRLSDLIRDQLYETKGNEVQEVDGSLYYPIYDIPVLKNEKGRYYAKLPSASIALPFGVDIKRVGTDNGAGFIPTQNGFNDLYRNLAASTLENQIGYFKSGTNIMFVNMTASNNTDKVNIDMVVPFGALDEDDEINIPADMLGKVVDVVFMDFVKTLQIPVDETNNSIDNK
jgi:acetolactate synthase regulatory subunit